MTDSSTPLSDADLSADLDDEAGIEVRARILGDPAATARRAELADAARRLSDAPRGELRADQVDALVANALEAADAPPAPRRAPRASGPWLVAAAVVALVAIGLTLVWTGREKSTTTAGAPTTTAAASEEQSLAAEGDEVAESGRDTQGAAPASGMEVDPNQTPYLGTFPDADALRVALASSLNTETATAASSDAPTTEALARCEQQLQITLELDGDPLATGYAVVDGELVLIYEWDHQSFTDGRQTTLVTAVGSDACDQVTLFER